MKTTRLIRTAALALALLAGATEVRATTINWGTYFSATSYLFDSNGVTLNDSYVFELGTFGSFMPNATNMADWDSNWKAFDMATFGSGWIPSSGTVGHSATLEEDFTTSNASLSQSSLFGTGEQAYIWIYSGTAGAPTLTSGFEWALVTNDSTDGTASDDWLMPAPSGHVVSTLDWRIEDATASPFGGLNDTQHSGDYSSTPGAFVLQTHTAPVPEPSSTLLIATTGLCILLRRRVRQ